ncbi:MAG: hypothetical protein KF760_28185 [Candidatus Eremiobacteraeota bacterium]|nr:hypothetical protein [Candidatus Eremiobacteraeota bacterium]MCW5872460.1 hypothetical protein [Candidatus Eremiobacteraeota bacterium]
MSQDNEFNQTIGLKGHWAHVLVAEGSLLTAWDNIPANPRPKGSKLAEASEFTSKSGAFEPFKPSDGSGRRKTIQKCNLAFQICPDFAQARMVPKPAAASVQVANDTLQSGPVSEEQSFVTGLTESVAMLIFRALIARAGERGPAPNFILQSNLQFKGD